MANRELANNGMQRTPHAAPLMPSVMPGAHHHLVYVASCISMRCMS
jgi:hypothetical protein